MPTALRRHRKARNLTQVDLAGLLAVSQANVSQWELGSARRPHPRHRQPLERLFGVPLDALLKDEDPDNVEASATASPGTAKNRKHPHGG